jgi:16S rRNA (adenine1518-N6/adenine1519-N6)-dimethyltransferase
VRKSNYDDLGCDPKLFKQVVKLSFGQRRKMLRNTLKSMIQDTAIEKDPIFSERPEQLSVKAFIDLTNKIAEIQHNLEV